MNLSRQPYTFDRVIRILFTIAGCVGTFYLIKMLKGALLPFLVAWLLAYLIYPLVEFYKKKCHVRNHALSIVIALLSIIAFLSLLGWIFIPSIIDETDKMREIISNYIIGSRQLPFLPDNWQLYLKENIDFKKIAGMLNREEWSKLIETSFTQAWTFISGSVTRLVAIVSWFIVLLYLFFILLDYDKIIAGFKALIPERFKSPVLGIVNDIKVSMNRYFRGQALVAFLVGILFSIGFMIMGLPLAIIFGLFIGLLNMVPYLQLISIPPALLLCLLQSAENGQNFWVLAAICMGIYIIVQLIQDTVLVPRIMGHVTGLNPAIILLSLSIWGTLLGVIGMIIALPMTSLLLAYYHKYILHNHENTEKKDTPKPPKNNKKE